MARILGAAVNLRYVSFCAAPKTDILVGDVIRPRKRPELLSI